MGHEVEVISPADYPTVPPPSYPEIRIAVWMRGLAERIDAFDPDAIHISTEGPIGSKVRRYCLRRGYDFTTGFHTRFPEYLHERIPVPLSWSYPLMWRFHAAAVRTLVPTRSLKTELEARGFEHMVVWGRGVDTALFHAGLREEAESADLERPIMLNVGRVAVEKNLEAFLALNVPGTRVVVGDGPALKMLREKYPDVVYAGMKHGAELAHYYAQADVFVFPSLTDTFGLVMLEALACGTPVAAFPVTGPLDVLQAGVTGVMDDNLAAAIAQALELDRAVCADNARRFSWKHIALQLLQAFTPVNSDKRQAMTEAKWVNQDIPA
jgi:glycosyltransferase involved in cell wall biosynthesis